MSLGGKVRQGPLRPFPFLLVSLPSGSLFVGHGAYAALTDGDPVPDLFMLAALCLAGWIAKRGEGRR